MNDRLRQSVIDTALAMNESGVNSGLSGNVSVRCTNGMMITPSGLSYDQLKPDDLVFVDMDGNSSGAYKPSSEWRFHRDI